ncbi:MAG: hypothetical protein R2818_14325 [Flavobacteriales bacterium]
MVWRNMQRFYKRSHDKHEWLFDHMTGFLGGYIATVSAFSAVNMEFITPVWLQELYFTIMGVPLIVLWTRYYKKRLTRGRRARDVFDVHPLNLGQDSIPRGAMIAVAFGRPDP